MRIALIADIHDMPALEAVMRDIRTRRKPDCILSLGDQVNLGPCPKETLALLRAENVRCLHGNHERYILSAMQGDPAYAPVNFAAARWNASLLAKEDVTFPETAQIEGVTFTHAMPGDDRFPVHAPETALHKLQAMRFDAPTHIVCGHGHNPAHYRLPNLTVDAIGSAGCMDEGVPGTTMYTLMTVSGGVSSLQPVVLPYDTAALPGLFRRGGMADFCPVMAHITRLQMQHNHDYLVPFVTKARALSAARGEACISRKTWLDTDRAFPWPDGVGTAAFWG